MATIGQPLRSPESGWKRYEQNAFPFKYTGTWTGEGSPNNSGGSSTQSVSTDATITFKFTGSKIRIIGYFPNSSKTNVKIDNDTFPLDILSGLPDLGCLLFERTNLSDTVHTVVISFTGTYALYFDAIDVEEGKEVIHVSGRKLCTSLTDMQIGDAIPCRYTASSGTGGNISEIGTCTAAEIPVAGSATPNGLFYFIKVDKGLLIADRVVQHSISWNALNSVNYIEGISTIKDINGQITNVLIRSLSGGCAYTDANGNFSVTDQGFGAFPVNNEWDTYIVKSDLNGKITKTDNGIWHFNVNTWAQNTPILGLGANNTRVDRGNINMLPESQIRFDYVISTTSVTYIGFRPVLEYIEPDGSSKQTTLWY